MNTPPSLSTLNETFQGMTPEARLRALYDYFPEEDVLLTSSFGIQSALLLYLIHRVRPGQTVYFIDTGFHFPETLAYKAHLTGWLGLRVEEVRPSPTVHNLSVNSRMWEKHPDACCHLHKVLPLKPLKDRRRVWVSGLMAHQTVFRGRLSIFEEPATGETIRTFHPLIDLTPKQHEAYRRQYALPAHSLEQQGYGSVGCRQCTGRAAGRAGRWPGKDKTECGLHRRPKP